MTSPGTVPIEALLEHHDFVRRLARSLVRDESAADDLAQDAWVAALESPPRATTSLRGWLASVVASRASNRRRSEERRTAREAAAARPHAAEPEKTSLERLELAHRVVAAVLALEDPYRSVILLAYYEGLAPAEIARRRGVPAGTVRSQLSRGHELLRGRLDQRYGGRRAWLALCGPLTLPRPAAGFGAKAVWFVAAACVAAGVGWVAWGSARRAPSSPIASARPSGSPRDLELLLALAEPPPGSQRVGAAARSAADPRGPAPADDAIDVSSYSLDELVLLAEQAQTLLCERTLDRRDDWPAELRSFSEREDAGIVWLVPRDRFAFEAFNPLGVRGGGAYYSFALRSHEYDQLADLELAAGELRSGFCGADRGFILPLNVASLADVPASVDAAPQEWSERATAQWRAMCRPLPELDVTAAAELDAEMRRLGVGGSATARAAGVYALRSVHPDDAADTLVAFQVVDVRDGALRIAWRRLAAFATPAGPRNVETAPRRAVGPPPGWLSALGDRALIDTLAEIRRVAQRRLFEIDGAFLDRYPDFADRLDRGLVRLLERNLYTRVVEKRGAGCCWSFATRDHDYGREPDVALQQGRLDSGFYGGTEGFVLDCGEEPIDALVRWGRVAPADWPAERQDAWAFLWDVRPVPVLDRPGAKALDAASRERADELGLRRDPEALVGHTYLVRSNLSEEHDLIAAFEVLERSETGITIVWRKLADFSRD